MPRPSGRSSGRGRSQRRFSLGLECLEDRTLLTPMVSDHDRGQGPRVPPHLVNAASSRAIAMAIIHPAEARRRLPSGTLITAPGQ